MKGIAIASITLACSHCFSRCERKDGQARGVGRRPSTGDRDLRQGRVVRQHGVMSSCLPTAMAEPPLALPPYEVSFYDELGPQRADEIRHRLRAQSSGRGAIHLPGRGDPRYRLNASTIRAPPAIGSRRPTNGNASSARLR